jgi:hypothetical protein
MARSYAVVPLPGVTPSPLTQPPPLLAGSRTFAELLIDCEEDRVLRAVLVDMLRNADRRA